MQAKRFTNNPFYSVPPGSPFELSMDADADSIVSQFVGTENQGKPFSPITLPLSVDLFKLPAFTYQGSFREF